MKEKDPNNPLFPAEDSPVPLPSVEDAWVAMRKKLDKEMPDRLFFWTRKRTLILLLALLLPLGAYWIVAYRDGVHSQRHVGMDSQRAAGINKRDGASVKGGVSTGDGAGVRNGVSAGDGAGVRNGVSTGDGAKVRNGVSTDSPGGAAVAAGIDSGRRQDRVAGTLRQEGGVATRRQKGEKGLATRRLSEEGGAATERPKEGSGISRRNSGKEIIPGVDGSGTGGVRGKDRGLEKAVIDARLAAIGTRGEIVAPKINTKRKTGGVQLPKTEKPKRLSPGDSTRIMYAAGLSDGKSFPVGSQQPVDYNANLKKDIWFDYVPTPFFQFYPGRKIGLQIAIQFNSPQYTEAVTIYRKTGSPTGTGSPYSNDTALVVKKLYYFNFPLTVYYSPFRDFRLGAGLQYSNLRNGVAFQNNVIHYTGPGVGQPDSVRESKLVSLKDNRPAYSNLKKSEWRALFEVNYYWKRLTLGVQYQQALGNYLHAPVEGSQGKDRNSSFNLYLRIDLWEKWVKINR